MVHDVFAALHLAAEALQAVQAEDAAFPAVLSRRRSGTGPVVPRLLGVSSNLSRRVALDETPKNGFS